ncbi:hypothetical protein EV586_107129 [Tumebacillus sp. BK434]|uniref:hypothetical protein n=1 Tax=Tumebacillus sp. BK434 TaxID=2512169 RepID=UPI0010476A9C|nr:hypothetical protein [Tumebacillus sp. BK434]TCP52886.1 hypothetical protein EV586_107129 [Tumebacillus sp. BK434]
MKKVLLTAVLFAGVAVAGLGSDTQETAFIHDAEPLSKAPVIGFIHDAEPLSKAPVIGFIHDAEPLKKAPVIGFIHDAEPLSSKRA